jgi:hypothetical protein
MLKLLQMKTTMTKKIFFILLLAFCFGCTKKQSQVLDCPAQPCTMIFASVNVQFKDKAGNVVEVKNYSAFNKRTGKNLVSANQKGMNEAGFYTIVDDGMRPQLSTQGDQIVVSATHPINGQTKTTTYKISGGCNCHVDRISGPQVITFD